MDENRTPYGLCPKCGSPGINRERRPNGYDTCQHGHQYLSSSSVPVLHHPLPPDYIVNAAGAIQHAVTVTRPEPTRAEMAMHFMAAALGRREIHCDSKQQFMDEMDNLAWGSTVAADALRAALDRKEAK